MTSVLHMDNDSDAQHGAQASARINVRGQSYCRVIVQRMTLDEFTAVAFDPTLNGAEPGSIRTISAAEAGTELLFVVSREDAREYFDSQLFDGGVCVVSVSAWDAERRLRPARKLEIALTLDKIYGGHASESFRAIRRLSASADYFIGLVKGDKIVAPTLFQDMAMRRALSAEPLPRVRR